MKIVNGVLSKVANNDIVNGKFIIPDSVTKIGDYAFEDCTNLSEIIMPNFVTAIGNWVFYNCIRLTSITIPYSVKSIENMSFDNCNRLDSINVNKDNEYYSSEDGVLFNKEKTTLIRYPQSKQNKKYIMPNSVIEIGYSAFNNCYKLESIIISNLVHRIKFATFDNCYNLTSINFPSSIIEIGSHAFYNCKKLKSKLSNYKGFGKGLICSKMRYIPNEWNTVDGDIEVCEWGLHYATNLFDVFNDYSGDLENDIEIWEVEVGNIVFDSEYNSKKATNAIKPIKRLTRQEIINILNNK